MTTSTTVRPAASPKRRGLFGAVTATASVFAGSTRRSVTYRDAPLRGRPSHHA